MTNVTILGSGSMARALATVMLRGNHPVQIQGRDGSSTRDLVESLGPGTTGGITGAAVTEAIVSLAVPHKDVHNAILEMVESLDGRVIVNTSNTVDVSTFDGLVTPRGTSSAEETALLLDGRAGVVKAFNTTFAATLEAGSVGRPASGCVHRGRLRAGQGKGQRCGSDRRAEANRRRAAAARTRT